MATVRLSTSLVGKLEIDLRAEDLRDAADLLVRRIRTRTEAGTDVNGAPFKAYSLGYAAAKQKALGHARVDLTVSGRMLNDMQVTDATPHGATISFVSQGGGATTGTFIQRSRALGAAYKAAYNDPSRHFFDASAEDERVMVEALERVLTERLAGE